MPVELDDVDASGNGKSGVYADTDDFKGKRVRATSNKEHGIRIAKAKEGGNPVFSTYTWRELVICVVGGLAVALIIWLISRTAH